MPPHVTDQRIRLFVLIRNGEVVADGVEYPYGNTILNWRGQHKSSAVYRCLSDLITVHGHEGETEILQVAMLDLHKTANLYRNTIQDNYEGVAVDFFGEEKSKNLKYVWEQREEFAKMFMPKLLNPKEEQRTCNNCKNQGTGSCDDCGGADNGHWEKL